MCIGWQNMVGGLPGQISLPWKGCDQRNIVFNNQLQSTLEKCTYTCTREKTIIFFKIYKQKAKQVLLAAQVYAPNMFGRKLAAPCVPTHPPIAAVRR